MVLPAISSPQSAIRVLDPTLERIARPRIPALQPAPEPPRALLGGAVGKGLRADASARPGLNAIIANRRSRIQAFLDVAALQDLATIGRVAPDAGVAVRLELESH